MLFSFFIQQIQYGGFLITLPLESNSSRRYTWSSLPNLVTTCYAKFLSRYLDDGVKKLPFSWAAGSFWPLVVTMRFLCVDPLKRLLYSEFLSIVSGRQSIESRLKANEKLTAS